MAVFQTLEEDLKYTVHALRLKNPKFCTNDFSTLHDQILQNNITSYVVPGDFRKRGFASRDDPRISFQRELKGCFRKANNSDLVTIK